MFLHESPSPRPGKDQQSSRSLAQPHKRAQVSPPPLLDVFQVHEPVLTAAGPRLELVSGDGVSSQDATALAGTAGAGSCSQVLVEYSFGNSYEHPFVGPYTPPRELDFDHVTFNLTVLSAGKQFDRLALLYLGDTEIFRTSTAEPTFNGIRWVYLKDMSAYLSLFKSPQKVIFDLGNLIDDTYTGPFNVTLTATFFTLQSDAAPAADVILPISAHGASADRVSAFSLPGDNATNIIHVPRNVRRAVASLSACGQIDEEFWFGNVLSSDVATFPAAGESLLGYSPFREVQLLIDGQLAGVAWPFPIVFTGGVVPGLWRPVVGLDAFDLREHEIDITPWLPILCDGASAGHSFEIRVVGLADDGHGHGTLTSAIGSYWVVTGKVFLWLDEPGAVTTGTAPEDPIAAEPVLSLSSTLTPDTWGGNGTLRYRVVAHRNLTVHGTVVTTAGEHNATWSQTLDYTNHGSLTQGGNVQTIDQLTTGSDSASTGYARTYRFPISVNTTFATDDASGSFSIDSSISRGLSLNTYGQLALDTGLDVVEALHGAESGLPAFTGTALYTTQNGSGHYESATSPKGSLSYGATEQEFLFGGLQSSANGFLSSALVGSYDIYRRHVLAINGTVARDEESLLGKTTRVHASSVVHVPSADDSYAASSVRATLGRGPRAGRPKPLRALPGDPQ
ncbi:MAG: hypothetical protein M1838_006178 [Thelocarpon superellum]|nr:MAG: hypothetical protein M1838_006178 [Thelocarpon superellum]